MINLFDIISNNFKSKDELFSNKELLNMLNKDLFLSPEDLAIYIYKLQNKIIKIFGETNSQEILQLLSYIQRMYTQMEIYYSAIIGDNLKIWHGLGTVIGARVVIGDNVTIYSNVTLGDRNDGGRLRPTICDGVTIGKGSSVFGGITIGKNSRINAHSLVLNSFPENSVIGNAPAKLIKMRNKMKDFK